MWVVFGVAGLQRRGFNLLLDPASELGQTGTFGATAFNVGFFLIPGLLIVVFALRLYPVLARRPIGVIASFFIGSGGLSLLLSGLIPMTPTSSQATLWHRLMGLPLLTTLPIGILLLSAALPENHGWRLERRLSLGAGSIMVALVAAYQVSRSTLPDGIMQRTMLLLLTAWFVAIGIRLVRESAAETLPSYPRGRDDRPNDDHHRVGGGSAQSDEVLDVPNPNRPGCVPIRRHVVAKR